MILALVDREPTAVNAVGGYYLRDQIADVTTTHLILFPEASAHIFVSWLHPFKEQKQCFQARKPGMPFPVYVGVMKTKDAKV